MKEPYNKKATTQPPSGGCVLKPNITKFSVHAHAPAAFGRLCVETGIPARPSKPIKPAAFGRLCVEPD
ncbi:hypothetical protein NEISICOT_03700 [Neisseria sicca ATCC 29256]|uniref:Uncharacterized protein n=1 Tax=Neisseria sicca ATCC 29256 TaxID=547045 RepID=C6MAW8_NEISI|nr:hypothetical protein NEISICOT_03700 [Neisseria sicca ATCC 29256]